MPAAKFGAIVLPNASSDRHTLIRYLRTIVNAPPYYVLKKKTKQELWDMFEVYVASAKASGP